MASATSLLLSTLSESSAYDNETKDEPMIRRIDFENWKSFSKSSLYIDQLTVLIGTNASGKSNALDALEFLSRTASSTDIGVALGGDNNLAAIRGQLEWASFKRGNEFTLRVLIGSDDDKTDYEYTLTVEVSETTAELKGEELKRIKYQGSNKRELRLFWTDVPKDDAPGMIARLYNTKSGTKKPVRRNLSVLSQLEIFPDLRPEIADGIREVSDNLKQIFILDPNPSEMRKFSRLSENYRKDGSNLAGVLMAQPEEKRAIIEKTITEMASKIPEKDISRVWAEYIGRHKTDAMLYCEEEWQKNEKFEVDARGMSDGTLRFIAVIASLLLRPVGSTVVIEEIDNGLHPSRAIQLLTSIQKLATERKIDLLITTHNVALLDSLPPSLIRSISVAIRNPETGASQISSLDDVPLLVGLITEGQMGKLAKNGKIEATIKKFLSDD